MNKSNEIYRSRINRANDYNNNLNKSISSAELASASFFLPFHLHRIFVAVIRESVNNFTNRVPLEKAAWLIKHAKNIILFIAFECGFDNWKADYFKSH